MLSYQSLITPQTFSDVTITYSFAAIKAEILALINQLSLQPEISLEQQRKDREVVHMIVTLMELYWENIYKNKNLSLATQRDIVFDWINICNDRNEAFDALIMFCGDYNILQKYYSLLNFLQLTAEQFVAFKKTLYSPNDDTTNSLGCCLQQVSQEGNTTLLLDLLAHADFMKNMQAHLSNRNQYSNIIFTLLDKRDFSYDAAVALYHSLKKIQYHESLFSSFLPKLICKILIAAPEMSVAELKEFERYKTNIYSYLFSLPEKKLANKKIKFELFAKARFEGNYLNKLMGEHYPATFTVAYEYLLADINNAVVPSAANLDKNAGEDEEKIVEVLPGSLTLTYAEIRKKIGLLKYTLERGGLLTILELIRKVCLDGSGNSAQAAFQLFALEFFDLKQIIFFAQYMREIINFCQHFLPDNYVSLLKLMRGSSIETSMSQAVAQSSGVANGKEAYKAYFSLLNSMPLKNFSPADFTSLAQLFLVKINSSMDRIFWDELDKTFSLVGFLERFSDPELKNLAGQFNELFVRLLLACICTTKEKLNIHPLYEVMLIKKEAIANYIIGLPDDVHKLNLLKQVITPETVLYKFINKKRGSMISLSGGNFARLEAEEARVRELLAAKKEKSDYCFARLFPEAGVITNATNRRIFDEIDDEGLDVDVVRRVGFSN